MMLFRKERERSLIHQTLICSKWKTEVRTMRVLSLGAGVNSTALLVLRAQGKVGFDIAVFADTGCEQPETYEYIEKVIKPFCKEHQIKLVFTNKEGKNLYDDNIERKIIPIRAWRSCTDKFKIRPIRKFLMANYPNTDITTIIGFCKGEEGRQKESGCGDIAPLITMGIDRDGCIKIIQDAGLPIPIKSGCYFCPHQPMKSWLNILKKHPDLYAKAEALEKNGSRYPEFFLPYDMKLESLRKQYEANKGDPEKEQKQASLLSTMPKSKGCPFCELEDNSPPDR
jgi:hypothetical protein